MFRVRYVVLFALALPILCRGEESCPWLNAGTAAGILDGGVSATVTHPRKNKEDATCDFVRRQGSLLYELTIEVETMGTPTCSGKTTPLKAIGNEAFACSVDKRGYVFEEVVGRARDRAFTISIDTDDPSVSQSSYREKVRKVAEQVAGALF